MIEHSQSIQKIAAALAKVAAEIENPHKNAKNPHFRSSYADLAEIINTVRPVASKHGVSVIQSPGMEEGLCTVETLLLHESGEWIRGCAKSPIQKQDPQGVGSATTYLRRYSLAGMLGLAQEDDDGNSASERRNPATGEPHARPKAQPATEGEPACPDCGGRLWDDRQDKKSPRAPDWKCRDKEGCGWALWLDTAHSKLKEAVENLEAQGTVKPGSTKHVMAGVEGGDLESLRLAQDWVNEKAASPSTAVEELPGSLPLEVGS